MKTFLNVLYRRILYKIPLKFLLLLVAIFGILFACYSSADYLDGFTYITSINNTNNSVYSETISNLGLPDTDGLVCFKVNSFGGNNRIVISFNTFTNFRFLSENSFLTTLFGCFNYARSMNNSFIVSDNNGNGLNFNMDIYYLKPNFTFTSGEPGYTSLQCQTEYNLIPISSVDQNYCTTNNLCPSQDCPVCPPSGGSGFSNVYINDILHVGAPNIVMNISEEIDWDYEYTAGGYNMNIDVVGYNVDYDKIDSIVQFQNYKPSSEDFQRIIGLLAPYTKIIVFFVFLFIVWAWIKKPFKSKKL